MKHNLIVTFDLFKGVAGLRTTSALASGQNYAAMEAAIKALGIAVKVNFSVWVVASTYSAADAVLRLTRASDSNDKVVVFDATTNTCSSANLDSSTFTALQQLWSGTATTAVGLAVSSNASSLASQGLINALRRHTP